MLSDIKQFLSDPAVRAWIPLFTRVTIWWALFYGAVRLEFGLVFVILSGLIGVAWHMRSGSSGDGTPSNGQPKVSAYSVFNPNAARMPGSLDASQFERELRHQPMVEANAAGDGSGEPDEAAAAAALRKKSSKNANKPCPCGSGKKFKHCCSNARAPSSKQREEFAKWKAEWGDEDDDDAFEH